MGLNSLWYLLQVMAGSSHVSVAVVEPLGPARAKGAVYRVTCVDGPWAGQDMVLKHCGSPQELARLRERRVDTSPWHQVMAKTP